MGQSTVFTPSSESALSEWIIAQSAPVALRGAATRLALRDDQALQISTSALGGIRLYEPEALTLVAGAGTPLAQIEETLAASGQILAFEPMRLARLNNRPDDHHGTLGGVVATNSSGPRRVSVGACRDFCLGLRFVDGQGRIVKNGGRVMKNVTGYDLVKLLAGSWGRLGVLTEVSLKTLPAPETSLSLVLSGLDAMAAQRAMTQAMNTSFEVSGAVYFLGKSEVVLRLEGFEASVDYRRDALCAVLRECTQIEIMDDASSRMLWQQVTALAPLIHAEGDIWRIIVKPSEAPDILARGAFEDAIVDWAGGQIWARTVPDSDLRAQLGALTGYAICLRGALQKTAMFAPQPGAKARLDAAITAQFDPKALFSSGRNG